MALFRMKPHYRKRSGVSYKGTATPLSSPTYLNMGTFVENYALFAGGVNSSYAGTDCVYAYDRSLTKTTPTRLVNPSSNGMATSLKNCCYFGGGISNSVINRYSSTLIRTYGGFRRNRVHNNGCAASVSDEWAVFIGGDYDDQSKYLDIFDSSLSEVGNDRTPYNYSKVIDIAGGSCGEYALFGGGWIPGNAISDTFAIDTSTTILKPTVLRNAVADAAAANTEDYILIVGGFNRVNNVDTMYNTVNAYNKELTRIDTVQSISNSARNLTGASIDNYMLFAGGNIPGHSGSNLVEIYNNDLIKLNSILIPKYCTGFVSSVVDKYVLFSGGFVYDDNDNGTMTDEVLVFQVT